MPRVTPGNSFLKANKDRVLQLYLELGQLRSWEILVKEEPLLEVSQLESFKAKYLKGVKCLRTAKAGFCDLSCLQDPLVAGGLLGFVLGDGFVEGNSVGFCSTDSEVIYQIKDLLKAENVISWTGERKNEAILRITHPDLAKWFLDRGIWERKSDKDSWDGREICPPDSGEWAFLRCWWETDGWNSEGFSWVNNSGKFLDYMREWLGSKGINSTRSFSGQKGYKEYPTLQVDARVEAWKLRELMYPEGDCTVPFIKRKREQASNLQLIPRRNQATWFCHLLGYPGKCQCTVQMYRPGYYKFNVPTKVGVVVVGRVLCLLESEREFKIFSEEDIKRWTTRTYEMPVGWYPSRRSEGSQ